MRTTRCETPLASLLEVGVELRDPVLIKNILEALHSLLGRATPHDHAERISGDLAAWGNGIREIGRIQVRAPARVLAMAAGTVYLKVAPSLVDRFGHAQPIDRTRVSWRALLCCCRTVQPREGEPVPQREDTGAPP